MDGVRGGATAGNPSGRVEGFFGDLVREVAIEAPVSRARLVRSLAAVDDRVREPGSPLSRSLSTTRFDETRIAVLELSEWEYLSRELTPATTVATREVHRRMARVLSDPELPPGTDPIVVQEA
jgi:hypothetical protein